MRPAALLLILAMCGCATNPELRVVRKAADAMTGSPWTVTAVASLTIEGTGTSSEPDGAFDWFQQTLNLKRGPSTERVAPKAACAEKPKAATSHHKRSLFMSISLFVKSAAQPRNKPSGLPHDRTIGRRSGRHDPGPSPESRRPGRDVSPPDRLPPAGLVPVPGTLDADRSSTWGNGRIARWKRRENLQARTTGRSLPKTPCK